MREKINFFKDEVLRLVDLDQQMRKSVQAGKARWDHKLDGHNTAVLKKLLKKNGWNVLSVLPKNAFRSMWLIVQHSPDRKFQQIALKHFKSLWKGDKNFIGRYIAYLEDRVRIGSGKKQLYGTQFKINAKKEVLPLPIFNENELNKRRKAVGLNSFKKYIRSAQRRARELKC